MKSRLYLPKLDHAPQTILEYLAERFPHIAMPVWRDRLIQGQVTDENGAILNEESRYRHGITVLYSREVAQEPPAELEETILHRDSNILIADKPHGMVVTPSGDHVERSLLVRLQKLTGLTQLTPVHRLDRETAGIVLFTLHKDLRRHYHRLFSEGSVEREYLAVAHLNLTDQSEWHVKNRLEEGEPWYRRRIAENSPDKPNAITRIERLESGNELGLFRLRPETGKKHQLRVHMASIECPIAGDLLYPEVRLRQEHDPPLQLLAYRLSFSDPLSGEPRRFTSRQELLWPMK